MGTQQGDPLAGVGGGLLERLARRAQAGAGASMRPISPPPCAGASRTGSPAGRPRPVEVESFLESLHVEDLALACACARGSETAWEHFVREFRPVLLRIASRGQQADRARDVADSVYAELYGLDERDGSRRSLFDYFHGRSSLAGWLKAVVAQRLVDKARAARRFEPLPAEEASLPGMAAGAAFELGPDRERFLDSCGTRSPTRSRGSCRATSCGSRSTTRRR